MENPIKKYLQEDGCFDMTSAIKDGYTIAVDLANGEDQTVTCKFQKSKNPFGMWDVVIEDFKIEE